ncbi:hypothetical protein BIT28_14170 [Photobacterium proteolyticum]|uniref:Uncharacterized protein n=1 Tax=Photobacterium proteolyticum TaxID=1903952 RepID=A0A1Q9H243_9GAMM|nr:hypothetical protein [Photobacterium proteolyticum]OLQ81665.1 hypothetical protein BIT28_14170 [Photobacterium proteolyticum]
MIYTKLHQCWVDFIRFLSKEIANREKIVQDKQEALDQIEQFKEINLAKIEKSSKNKSEKIAATEKAISDAAAKGDLDALKKHLDSLK